MPPRTRTLRATSRRPSPTDGHAASYVLPVCGELDFLTADQVRARIQALAERHRQVTVPRARGIGGRPAAPGTLRHPGRARDGRTRTLPTTIT